MSSIRLRQYRIASSPFAHNFLVLHNDDGTVKKELHGLPWDPVTKRYIGIATAEYPKELEDPSNLRRPEVDRDIGRSSDYLRALEVGPNVLGFYRHGQNEKILMDRPGDALDAEWEALVKTGEKINGKGLSYSATGTDIGDPRFWDTPRPKNVTSGNSNSVNRTLLDGQRIPVPSMQLWAPGQETPLLTDEELFPPQIKGGLLSPDLPKAGLLSPYQPNGGLPTQPRESLLGPIY